jgi:hypothetical protein
MRGKPVANKIQISPSSLYFFNSMDYYRFFMYSMNVGKGHDHHLFLYHFVFLPLPCMAAGECLAFDWQRIRGKMCARTDAGWFLPMDPEGGVPG